MSLGFTGPAKLNEQGPLPQMNGAFKGWKSSLFLIQTTQVMVEGEVTLTTSETPFEGVKQPMSAKQIALKPEGQRAFQWFTLHVDNSELNLDVNDRVKFNDTEYKIMEIWPWNDAGFIEYHMIERYE